MTKAGETRNTNIEAEGLEKIQLAVMASHDNRGINTTSLAKNLSEINGLTDTNNNEISDDTEITLPENFKLNDSRYILYEDGNVEIIKEGKLPSRYQQVEYIESNGKQYIDTNFIPNQDSRLIVDCNFEYVSNRLTLFGERYGGSRDTNAIYFGKWSGHDNYNFAFYYGSNYGVVYRNDLFGIRHKFDANKNKFLIDGETIFDLQYYNFDGEFSFYLFALADNWGISNPPQATSYCSCKLYSSQIYDNEKIIRNYIPCYRISDDVIGMYDTVEGKFYTNANTTAGAVDFTAGPEV